VSDWIVNDGPQDYCFGCGQQNESGFRLRYRRAGESSVEAEYAVPKHFRGAEGVVHGGIQAALLDEIMGLTVHTVLAGEDHKIVTAEMSVRYRKPMPIETLLTIRGHLSRTEGSNLFLNGEILDDRGELLTEGQSRFRRLR
jgi:uncharacterized protein (TIGR00369 family)